MLSVELLKKMPFASIDLHFAAYIQEQSKSDDPRIFAAAAIASAAVRQGNTCCNLNYFKNSKFSDFFRTIVSGDEEPDPDSDADFPSLEDFRDVLKPPVGIVLEQWSDEENIKNIPLILDPDGRLYLNRFFLYEKDLAEQIMQFVKQPENKFAPQKDEFNSIISYFHLNPGEPVKQTDWQKFAAYLAGISPLTVITGGPGTGKTTVVAAVLALILEKFKKETPGKFPRIMLCAPTGKAQSRLAESIRSSLKDLQCSPEVRTELEWIIDPANPEKTCGTIHSLLGVIKGSTNFRRNQDSPLNADILLADEVSMISLPLMCKLMHALRPETKVILLGDKDQLASVESGAVLGDLCKNVSFNVLSENHKKIFTELTNSPAEQINEIPADSGSPMTGHIAELKISRRFDENSQIGIVSSMIREKKDPAEIASEIMKGTDDFIQQNIPHNPEEQLKIFFGKLPGKIRKLTGVPTVESMKTAYFLLENHKILCALRSGNSGVEKMNELCRKLFRMTSDQSIGLPLLILQNDQTTGLSNGDIGIIWDTGNGTRVYFPASKDDPEPKSFYLYELPPYEPVFAMTIHKSQGSGFDNVLISMPPKETPILTRELLYTAITRARKKVELWCPAGLISSTLSKEVMRHSGLADRLKRIRK